VTPNSNSIEVCVSKPSIPRRAASAPKIKVGIKRGKTKIDNKSPPRFIPAVNAAPNVPMMLSAGVPNISEITKKNILPFVAQAKLQEKVLEGLKADQ